MMKKNIFLFLILILCFFAFSQSDKKSDEKINLGEISTVVTGNEPEVSSNSIGDYSDVIPKTENSEIVPRLKDASEIENDKIDSDIFQKKQEKSVYAEGRVGLGYPAFFVGDFSIFRQSGNNPFKIDFLHESENGYAGNSLNENYFDKTTNIEAEKTFSWKKMRLYLFGNFSLFEDGLQKKSDSISGVSKNEINILAKLDAKLPKNVSIKTSITGDFYKRYASIASWISGIPDNLNNDKSLKNYERLSSIFYFNPKISFDWQSSDNSSSSILEQQNYFWTSISIEEKLQYDIKNYFDDRISNRVDFSFFVGYKSDFLKVSADAFIVVGDKLGDHKVLVPFDLFFDFTIPTKISERKLKFSVAGGLMSELPKVYELEKKYKFSILNLLPAEESFWYGDFQMNLPIKNLWTFSISAFFKTTALDNKTAKPFYEEKYFSNGQYLYDYENLTQFNTSIGLNFHWKIATFFLNWKSFWLDENVIENAHEISLLINLQDKKSLFNFDAEAIFPFGENDDKMPVLDVDLTFKVSKAVSLSATVSDFIKLITRGERQYAGCYIRRSGYCAILAKFMF